MWDNVSEKFQRARWPSSEWEGPGWGDSSEAGRSQSVGSGLLRTFLVPDICIHHATS